MWPVVATSHCMARALTASPHSPEPSLKHTLCNLNNIYTIFGIPKTTLHRGQGGKKYLQESLYYIDLLPLLTFFPLKGKLFTFRVPFVLWFHSMNFIPSWDSDCAPVPYCIRFILLRSHVVHSFVKLNVRLPSPASCVAIQSSVL